MSRIWLPVVLLVVALTGCSSFSFPSESSLEKFEKTSSAEVTVLKPIEIPHLNLDKPKRPDLINDLEVFGCVRNEIPMLCVDKAKFKNHLNDLTEILRYQLELENLLDTYIEYYEPNSN